MARQGHGIVIDTDMAMKMDQVGQLLATSNREFAKELNKRARPAGRELVNRVKAAAPKGRTGIFKRTGIKLSVKRGRVYLKVAGKWRVQPTNLGYLLIAGHRLRHGGMSRAEDFLNPVLDRWRPVFQKQMEDGVRDTIAKFERDLYKKIRDRKLRSLARSARR